MKILSFILFLFGPALVLGAVLPDDRSAIRVEDQRAWYNDAKNRLQQENAKKKNTNRAKNIIVFIGDGFGISSITASRIYKGQLAGNKGEESYHSFDLFSNVGLIKTYSTDKQVTDSAASATAILCGVKTKQGMLGVDQSAPKNPCDKKSFEAAKVESLLTWAQKAGMRTGLVTTTRITHATPAAAYAQVPNRGWESDTRIPKEYRSCVKDIARQLVEDAPGKDLNVIFGGGMCQFVSCRSDNENLLSNWKQRANAEKLKSMFVMNKIQMDQLTNETKVLGLFDSSHMSFDLERDKTVTGQPSIAEMTAKAISLLQNGDKGFFLLVEGGRIDHAHHLNLAKLALADAVSFEKAVQTALNMTSSNDTLIVVTADHSHTMTINGYPDRGNDILGLNKHTHKNAYATETLTYANGPGFLKHRKNGTIKKGEYPWNDPSEMTDRNDSRYSHFAPIYKAYESHGGEDVAIFANGPFSHLFNGVYEQNYIAHAISCAGQIGPSADLCSAAPSRFGFKSFSFASLLIFKLVLAKLF
ncbi:alkaline phosphatase 4-like [Cloeon dipterum]|uniref:alkaline phosphatase 4-like n=1 Tax=Cloeon dipterum TaxID=197152 RepID=UPI00321FA869